MITPSIPMIASAGRLFGSAGRLFGGEIGWLFRGEVGWLFGAYLFFSISPSSKFPTFWTFFPTLFFPTF